MGAPEPILGLDLGSSKTCVAAVDAGGMLRLLADSRNHTLIPAVISFHPDGEVLVGADAVVRRTEDPVNTLTCDLRPGAAPVVTRAGRFKPVDIAAVLLDHMRRLAGAAMQVDTKRVLLTAPHGYSDQQRAILVQAASNVGLQIEGVISSPVAAAYAYGLDQQHPQFLAICDFGAAKFECSILSIRNGIPELLGSATDASVSGNAVDERLVDWMVDAFQTTHQIDLRRDRVAMDRFRAAAEACKRQLSRTGDYGVQVEVPGITFMSDGRQVGLQLLLTWDVFRDRTHDLIENAILVCDNALHRAGVGPEQLGQVIAIGGGCRLQPVRDRLAAFFSRAPRMDVDPQAACALGAALVASRQTVLSDRITSPYGAVSPPPEEEVAPPVIRKRATRVGRVVTKKMFTAMMEAQVPSEEDLDFVASRPTLVEVTATRLALSTVGGFCDEVIPNNTPIPTEKTRIFSTGKDNQPAVRVRICQGDSRKFHENMPLGTLMLERLPPRPRGQVRIAVTFEIDDDGVLEASALDEETGQEQTVRIQLPG